MNGTFYKNLLDNLYDGVYFTDRDRVITYWNQGAERISGYRAGDVIGISCKDGTIVGAVEVFTDNTPKFSALQRVEELEKVAYVDPLTGIPNRRYVETQMRARLDEMERYAWPFGIMYIDIDHFKTVNDEYGHDTGDEVLKMVARTLQHATRSFDVVGRWGGEEFLAVLAAVDKGKLHTIGERFRSMVENSAVSVKEGTVRTTISLGGVVCREGEALDSLVKRADELLYRSKESGRNRLTLGD